MAKMADAALAELVNNTPEEEIKRIRGSFRKAVQVWWDKYFTYQDITDDIMESDVFSEARATLIADTEVATATGQGALAGYKEAKAAGVKLKKIWVYTDDPCDDCQENQDAGAIDVEDEFPSGDDAEVAHPFCRCHTESVVEEDSDNDDE